MRVIKIEFPSLIELVLPRLQRGAGKEKEETIESIENMTRTAGAGQELQAG
jgi:hypothetical protein